MTSLSSSDPLVDSVNSSQSSCSALKVLKLLDSYSRYHHDGSESFRKTYWNLTKARCRSSGGGAQAALLLPPTVGGESGPGSLSSSSNAPSSSKPQPSSSSQRVASSDMTTSAILSLMGNNENRDSHVVVQTRSAVAIVAGSRNEESTTDVRAASIRFRLIDPVQMHREQQQLQQQPNANQTLIIQPQPKDYNSTDNIPKPQTDDQEKEDFEDAGELVDENSSPFQTEHSSKIESLYGADPTQSTGLRQRKHQQQNQHQHQLNTDEKMKESLEKVTFTNKNDGSKMVTEPIGKDFATSENRSNKDNEPSVHKHVAFSTTPTFVVDPFDLGMLLINCSSSHRNEIKMAQANAIQSLKQYIHAATLVAAIQTEINDSIHSKDEPSLFKSS